MPATTLTQREAGEDGADQVIAFTETCGVADLNTATALSAVLNVSGFRFFFYSLDGTEPRHIHVERGESAAKFWLDPVQLAGSRGFRAHELNLISAMVTEHRAVFGEAWDRHFGT